MTDLRAKLKYVVPGYVWQQARFHIDWESARSVVEARSGIVVIESMDQKRREYAAASFLSLLVNLDYHADVGWTSFYPSKEHEFYGSYKIPKHKSFQAIALKGQLEPAQEEQVQDLASTCKIAVIAAYPGFRIFHRHVRIGISARELASKDYQSRQDPVVI
jgi:hypothetical protein